MWKWHSQIAFGSEVVYFLSAQVPTSVERLNQNVFLPQTHYLTLTYYVIAKWLHR